MNNDESCEDCKYDQRRNYKFNYIHNYPSTSQPSPAQTTLELQSNFSIELQYRLLMVGELDINIIKILRGT